MIFKELYESLCKVVDSRTISRLESGYVYASDRKDLSWLIQAIELVKNYNKLNEWKIQKAVSEFKQEESEIVILNWKREKSYNHFMIIFTIVVYIFLCWFF